MMERNLISSEVSDYLTTLVPTRPAEMQKMEAYAEKHSFPIIGPVVGYFCYQIARLSGAKKVFEMGSGYGYSTAWFARAVIENGGGEVHHVVWDEKLSLMAKRHLNTLGFGGIIRYQVSEAVEALRKTPGSFDLIFNDIDKEGYLESLPVIAEKLRTGGVLIIDNMLWYGRIFDTQDISNSTRAIKELTRRLTNDPGWISTMIPIRDGLLVAYKI